MPHPTPLPSMTPSTAKTRFFSRLPRPPHPSLDPSPHSGSGRVRVVARVRPVLPSEIQSHGSASSCVSYSNDPTNDTTLHIRDTLTSREGHYKVDSCYGEKDEISVIFASEVEPFLSALFEGHNATVFAYGATGSGKTYTMQGSEGHPGLMPLAMMKILSMSEETHFKVQVSYYEVYMERCYDLLEDKGTEVSILEDNDGKIQLRGLSQVHVKTLAEFKILFTNGCLKRKVGQTGLNDVSSRSHGLLTISVSNADNDEVIGKLNLIDLAGNEDNRRTGNGGVRLVESSSINQSLFVLSNVINALNSNEPRVPYRDSKLTRILQDSLGGKTRAIMIACLNPRSYQEAVHTLSLATRSRQLVHSNVKTKDPQPKLNMEEKLQAWRDAKSKGSPCLSTPRKFPKPLFHTPSHHHINQIRRMERDLPRNTPKARRILLMQKPNYIHEKEKAKEVARASSQERVQSNVSQRLYMNEETSCAKDNEIIVFQGEGSLIVNEDTSAVERSNVDDADVLSVTPSIKKPLKLSTSPPLSERLQNLRSAMREILHPVHENHPSPILMKKLSPVKSPPNSSGFCERHEENVVGTPLEKLNTTIGSGMKNSIAKEFITFLNTASREELIELKGIGEKRAANILSLRDNTPQPLKEIEDLEQIGISKKQAMTLFSHSVGHILFS